MAYNKFGLSHSSNELAIVNKFMKYVDFCRSEHMETLRGGYSPEDDDDSIVLFPDCIIRKNKKVATRSQLYMSAQKDAEEAALRIFSRFLMKCLDKERKITFNLQDSLDNLNFKLATTALDLQEINFLICLTEKQNEFLSKQLEDTLRDCQQVEWTCKRLKIAISNTNAHIDVTKQHLASKTEDVTTRNQLLTENMVELYNKVASNEELLAVMYDENRNVKLLEDEIAQLLKHIHDSAYGTAYLESQFEVSMDLQIHAYERAMTYIRKLEVDNRTLEVSLQVAKADGKYADRLMLEGDELRKNFASLEWLINESLEHRCTSFVKIFAQCTKVSLQMLAVVMRSVLPAMFVRELLAELYIEYDSL